MRVAVDLDGVVYDFVEALRLYLVQVHGYDRATLTDPTTWEFYPEWGLTADQFNDHCTRSTDEGWMFSTGDPIPGAREALEHLHSLGHTIHVVTARNFGRFSEINTRLWLDEHSIPRQSLTFAHDKSIIDADIFIDDKPSNVDKLRAVGKNAWLLKDPACPSRRDADGHPFLVDNWDHFVQIVDFMMEMACHTTPTAASVVR